jgi:predicted MPP superfamily phosphohydrolase
MKRRKFGVCLCALAAVLLLGVFLWWNNSALTLSEIRLEAPVKREIRILHLSDLHGAWFGKDQCRIAAAAEGFAPDVIVITGDSIDEMHDSEAAYSLIRRMADIAPTYCVTGNHEELVRRSGSGAYETLIEVIENTENAHLLRGKTVYISETVTLTGAEDVPFAGGLSGYGEYISRLGGQKGEAFSVLLAHRPEMVQYYAAAGFDLTLSGHAHGGQIRLPFVGGLFAPGQGVLPEYDAGLYEAENGTKIYVSRGLGNSIFPFRLFNRPEIAVIDIVSGQQRN